MLFLFGVFVSVCQINISYPTCVSLFHFLSVSIRSCICHQIPVWKLSHLRMWSSVQRTTKESSNQQKKVVGRSRVANKTPSVLYLLLYLSQSVWQRDRMKEGHSRSRSALNKARSRVGIQWEKCLFCPLFRFPSESMQIGPGQDRNSSDPQLSSQRQCRVRLPCWGHTSGAFLS